jgi:methionyl-tRNA formyltransferase
MLCRHLSDILDKKLGAEPQHESEATYAGKIRKDDAAMNWQETATDLLRRVRAYNPVPGAFFEFDGERVKCWLAALADGDGEAGTVITAGRDGIDIACGSGVLRMLELQRPGRRRVSAGEFANQIPLTGKRLG